MFGTSRGRASHPPPLPSHPVHFSDLARIDRMYIAQITPIWQTTLRKWNLEMIMRFSPLQFKVSTTKLYANSITAPWSWSYQTSSRTIWHQGLWLDTKFVPLYFAVQLLRCIWSRHFGAFLLGVVSAIHCLTCVDAQKLAKFSMATGARKIKVAE